MKILVDVGHPAHAHFFRYIIGDLQASGHKVKLAAREREMLFYLLDRFGLDYTVIGRTREGIAGKAVDMLKKDMALARVVDEFKPELMMATGSGSPYTAQVGKLKDIPTITCTDTEHARFINWLTLPFSNIICTPSCYTRPVKARYHVKYNGYHELAYLHPDRYGPDGSIRSRLGLDTYEKIILLKFARWTASHDLGVSGFAFEDAADMIRFVESFEEFGTVFISSEIPLPGALKDRELKLPYEKIHDLLAECALYFGEGATMASEAAVLGVPSIFISTLRLGYLDELEHRYDLAYSFPGRPEAVGKAVELLTEKDTAAKWQDKRKTMLADKIDVSSFITGLVNGFPHSVERFRTDLMR